MCCPHCSSILDKKAKKGVERVWRQQKRAYDRSYQRTPHHWSNQRRTYVPPAGVPSDKWIQPNVKSNANQPK